MTSTSSSIISESGNLTNSQNQNDITEEMLLAKSYITPEDVLILPKFTKNYLCPIDANIYGIEFINFKIRDLQTNNILFDVSLVKDNDGSVNDNNCENDSFAERFIRYQFTPNFLNLKSIGATFEFKVANKPIKNLRLIEKHYFKNELLRCFDFDFGFCIPHSTNTCEHIYELPMLTKSYINELIDHPFESKSDSFYFADGKLVMHAKAEYSFNGVSQDH